MEIVKILYNPTNGLNHIEYNAADENMRLESFDKPMDSFYEALRALRKQACAVMGMGSTLAESKLAPVGVSFTRDKDNLEQYQIICVWRVVAGEYIRIKLPKRQTPVNPLDEPQKELMKVLENLKVQAEMYINGRRAEQDLFVDKAEGTANDDGNQKDIQK